MRQRNYLTTPVYAILTALIVTVPAFAGTLPDTGQTVSYAVGDDGYYAPCNRHSYTDLGNGIVRDNVTGLEWQQSSAPGTYTWQQATDYCNNLVLGGHYDWRLPTVKELSFLVDLSIPLPGPSIDPIFSISNFTHFWSSTNSVYPSTDEAWYIGFTQGGVKQTHKSFTKSVRAVRGRKFSNNFIDNGDGTITDRSTGLMWQKDRSTSLQWDEALAYCENLTLANYTDWRLPNLNELRSDVRRPRSDDR